VVAVLPILLLRLRAAPLQPRFPANRKAGVGVVVVEEAAAGIDVPRYVNVTRSIDMCTT